VNPILFETVCFEESLGRRGVAAWISFIFVSLWYSQNDCMMPDRMKAFTAPVFVNDVKTS